VSLGRKRELIMALATRKRMLRLMSWKRSAVWNCRAARRDSSTALRPHAVMRAAK
jgi:hypothetical protein